TFENLAKLEAHIFTNHSEIVLQAIKTMLNELADFGNENFGRGGWGVRIKEQKDFSKKKISSLFKTGDIPNPEIPYLLSLEIISGGQDVADAIIDAAEEIFNTLSNISETEIYWEQIPR
ncbi:MAG: hypothetical protein SPG61_04375, partial [Arcanobacterium sp.]|nr:hypothetical protein [Arcanobacterium sp.]